jgi:ATP phosphoribosyltransferase
MLQGAMAANGKVGMMLNAPKDNLDAIVKIFPPGKKPTISELSDQGWVALNVILEEKLVRDIVPDLKNAGAEDIVEYPLNKIIH